MSKHLLALSIGPVQGFIAAARRTRDLWCGSVILSEICKAAGNTVAEESGRLIFPALDKGDPRLRRFPESAFNVANIILAELPDGIPPSVVAAKAEAAAQGEWIARAEKAMDEAKAHIDPERWELQVHDVIEFYAAWAPFNGDYQVGRQRVMHLMAGRKACRDFRPDKCEARVPKSSLDGARDTVWKYPLKIGEMNAKLGRRLRLSEGEQLDAVGLTKRLAFGIQRYPSVSRIAADPWLRGLKKASDEDPRARRKFEKLMEICKGLVQCGLGLVNEKLFPDFPFEGNVVYRNRHKDLDFELGETPALRDLGDRLGKEVSDLVEMLGEPEPYLAVIVADGDHMGKTISRIGSPEEHRQFSGELARFADEARRIVESFSGTLVYSGGDDVLALLPVDTCLECAQDLHLKFSSLLKEFKTTDGRSPTLSVGIAIGHFMEPLENLLEYGRAAEKAAKEPDRDGLAVHVHVRGGAPVTVRGQWGASGMLQRLNRWRKLLGQDLVSHKTAFDMRELARDYAGWPQDADTLSAIRQDLLRLLNKKKPAGKEKLQADVIDALVDSFGVRLAQRDMAPYHAEVIGLAHEFIVAWRIVRSERQAQGFARDEKGGRS